MPTLLSQLKKTTTAVLPSVSHSAVRAPRTSSTRPDPGSMRSEARQPSEGTSRTDSGGAPVSVVVEYCEPGNLGRPARALARALEQESGCEVRLVPSRDGVFEVLVAGRLVFSKRASRRLPDADEILYHVLNA